MNSGWNETCATFVMMRCHMSWYICVLCHSKCCIFLAWVLVWSMLDKLWRYAEMCAAVFVRKVRRYRGFMFSNPLRGVMLWFLFVADVWGVLPSMFRCYVSFSFRNGKLHCEMWFNHRGSMCQRGVVWIQSLLPKLQTSTNMIFI